MGRRDPRPRLAGRPGLLARAQARRRRVGHEAAAAVLLLARRDADPGPADARCARLRPPDDAQHGSAGARPAAEAAEPVIHLARGDAAMRGPCATGYLPGCTASLTSPRTWPPTCRC